MYKQNNLSNCYVCRLGLVVPVTWGKLLPEQLTPPQMYKLFLICFRMRTYQRKTERGTTSIEVIRNAAEAVMQGQKIKTVARQFGICHMTLFRFVKKVKSVQEATVGYKKMKLVFNEQQEKVMAEYLLKCSSIYFGLVPQEVRKLAYECALKFDHKNIPPSWHKFGMAGSDWLSAFLKRNPRLSIRTPEATSFNRATSFNKHNIDHFFSKLGDILIKHNLPPSKIWNVDETGVLTVQKPKKIVAGKGIKQVGSIVSAERGTLVTLEMAVNAFGNTIPPMFVFPRLKYKDLFIRDGPPESIGAGNSSGWMTATEFLIYMDHFIKHVKPTPSEPVLLLLDNHSSHTNINVVEKAKANGVIMLSFPPHCTHRLQPLDVGVYGPFKSYCAIAQDTWMRNNPGKTMSIYEIPGIVKYAWPLASITNNIINAFKKTGICPYNKNIFTNEEFAPSYVTDRHLVENQEPAVLMHHNVEKENEPQPGPSNVHNVGQSIVTDIVEDPVSEFSPEIVHPVPKATPRQKKSTRRRVRKSAVLTDTPEKNALAEEQSNNKRKKEKISSKTKNKGKGKVKRKSKDHVKRKILQEKT